VDFTPLLGQLRDNHARASKLLRGTSMVLCLGSRALLSTMVGSSSEPERILGAATSEAEGLALVKTHQPGLLFASDRLEQGCGVSLVVAVKQRFPHTRTLLLVSQEHRQGRIRKAIEACCDGVVVESRIGLGTELNAIRSVCSGGIWIDRQIGSARPALQPLSPRETEVLQRVVRGESNGTIAAELYLSLDTIKTHVRNVLRKLEARDRAHAVAIGLHLGLVDYWPQP
jgi:DNA-binding NarL/FixJ family response regulator